MNMFKKTVNELLIEAEVSPIVKRITLYNKIGTNNFLTGTNNAEIIEIHDGDQVTEVSGKIYFIKRKGVNVPEMKYGSSNSTIVNVNPTPEAPENATAAPGTPAIAPAVQPTA